MTTYEIERELVSLYRDLEVATQGDEQTVCLTFNTDSREEIVALTRDEIAYYERKLREIEEHEHRTLNYQRTADAPFLCW